MNFYNLVISATLPKTTLITFNSCIFALNFYVQTTWRPTLTTLKFYSLTTGPKNKNEHKPSPKSSLSKPSHPKSLLTESPGIHAQGFQQGWVFPQEQCGTYWGLPQINWHKSSTLPKPGKKRKLTENEGAADCTVINCG